jgi:hypothetical protein
MKFYKIPITEAPDQSFNITMGGTLYGVRLTWNILGYWTVSILDINKNNLLSGIKIVLEVDLFKDHPDIGLPPGSLYAVDFTYKEDDIGRYDFINDRDVQLLYVSY